ncbi:hypothetical protein NURINAE_01077 [Candidatus Nitrosacidococcus sp. I8]|nr:hypothetical protein NURINAE_01077 [Candidatus Nitrosacidococcus sp. I8]
MKKLLYKILAAGLFTIVLSGVVQADSITLDNQDNWKWD